MDEIDICLMPYQRLYPHAFPVWNIGYFPSKTHWISHIFTTVNYSIILEGEGVYQVADKEYEVKAPCVIIEWPGEYVNYGPHTSWEEFYLMYDPHMVPLFLQSGFLTTGQHIWQLTETEPFYDLIQLFLSSAKKINVHGKADSLDRLSESVILQSRLSGLMYQTSEREQHLLAIRRRIEEDVLYSWDFDSLAREINISTSHFRRLWQQYFGISPKQYITKLRIRIACQLLTNADLSIAEIATRLNFTDPYYFSRVFHQVMHQTASSYRKNNCLSKTLTQMRKF